MYSLSNMCFNNDFYLALTVPWFWGEVKGHSLLYENMPTTPLGWAYFFLVMPTFLLFTDFGIYWIHRYLHHPILYKRLHKVKEVLLSFRY